MHWGAVEVPLTLILGLITAGGAGVVLRDVSLKSATFAA